MSGFLVVYEVSRDGEGTVLRVHAVPAAPGTTSVPGPRTFCGRDTFAMTAAAARPNADPGAEWYPAEYADRLCPGCDDAVGGG